MAEKEFKKVALQDVSGDYIAPVAYSALFDKDGDVIDISSLATQVDVDNNINNLSKVAVTHTQGSSVGSSSTPVYVNSSGQAVACSSISVNLINSTMISRFYVNGKSGYRVWSNGFKEVWGYGRGTISFPNTGSNAFTNADSIHVVTGIRTQASWDGGGVNYSNETDCIGSVTTTGFNVSQIMAVNIDWYAFGY